MQASATAVPSAAKLYSCGPEIQDLMNKQKHSFRFICEYFLCRCIVVSYKYFQLIQYLI